MTATITPPPAPIPVPVNPPQNVLYVLAEKVLSTYIQALIALLVLGPTINVSIAQSAAIAAIPAALTFLANNLPGIPVGLPFWLDLLLRAARTYVVSFIGFLVAVPVFQLKFSVFTAAAAAALPGALAVIKAGVAQHVGSSGTASLLPANLDVLPLPTPVTVPEPVKVGAHVAPPGDPGFTPDPAPAPAPTPGPPPAPPTES